MKKFLTTLMLIAASCSVTEASGWINNLLSLKNPNYVTDSAGTITMDGFTFTLHQAKNATTAIYKVHIGEFAKKEAEFIGYCRFDIIDAALNDTRVAEPLIRYQMADTPEAALAARNLNVSEVLVIPQKVVNERFLRTVRGLTNRALQTNGATPGEPFPIVTDSTPADTTAQYRYLLGLTTGNGLDISLEEVLLQNLGANLIPPGYYRDAQWRFHSSPTTNSGIYQMVNLVKAASGSDPDGNPYFDADSARPKREAGGDLPNNFIGVQRKADGVYFYYPSAAPNSYFKSPAEVSFSAHAVKVSRPMNSGDII